MQSLVELIRKHTQHVARKFKIPPKGRDFKLDFELSKFESDNLHFVFEISQFESSAFDLGGRRCVERF